MIENKIKNSVKLCSVPNSIILKETPEEKSRFVACKITRTKREHKLHKKNTYKKFLGSLIKKGNITAAKQSIHSAFINVSVKEKKPVRHVFYKIFSKLTCRLEMKKVNMRRNTHTIPFPIRTTRQNFLKIRWILNTIKKDTRQVSQSEKISTELLDILVNKRSKVLLEKKQLKKDVLANRTNVHFRW